MAFQTFLRRYELKYLLTYKQKEEVLAAMEPYMAQDRYGRSLIRNLYFDTDTFRMIRRSIEKPTYKEKLRLRAYGTYQNAETVFVELKKKYHGVVYKRRLVTSEAEANAWLLRGQASPDNSQIAHEISYVLAYYGSLHPVAFLSYQREAYFCREGGDFRVAFDDSYAVVATTCRFQQKLAVMSFSHLIPY